MAVCVAPEIIPEGDRTDTASILINLVLIVLLNV